METDLNCFVYLLFVFFSTFRSKNVLLCPLRWYVSEKILLIVLNQRDTLKMMKKRQFVTKT